LIHIIGLGVSEFAELNSSASSALASAAWVIGSVRQLAVVAQVTSSSSQHMILPPLKELAHWLEDRLEDKQTSQNIVVLASGDPLFYGIGRWFSKNYPADDLCFYPAISSIQAACHQLGLSLQDIEVLSLHGRPLAQIRKTLKPAQTLVVLSDKQSQPQALAQECIGAGFEHSEITVCENLGYAKQAISRFDAQALSISKQVFEPLHLSVIKVQGKGGVLPSFPGIPDDDFISDASQKSNEVIKPSNSSRKAMLTKREVRLAILSLMQANNADVIWDIGAGCGSVSVELAYWNKNVQVHAIEHHAERLACLEANRSRFGVVSQLHITMGTAPECLAGLPTPSKVFIGGSDGRLPELLTLIWQTLTEDGLLVVSAVTEASKLNLLNFMNEREQCRDASCETLQIAVSKGSQLAGKLVYRPSLPVSLFKFTKLPHLCERERVK